MTPLHWIAQLLGQEQEVDVLSYFFFKNGEPGLFLGVKRVLKWLRKVWNPENCPRSPDVLWGREMPAKRLILQETTLCAPMISNFINELKLYRNSLRRLFCYDWVRFLYFLAILQEPAPVKFRQLNAPLLAARLLS